MAKYYISDLHFHHFNIIKFCNRPFTSIFDMNQTMITNWNNTVKNDDEVYFLGDFSFSKKDIDIENVFNLLNGKKYLILGNHDHSPTKRLPWVWVKDIYEMVDAKDRIVLFHYPMREWNGFYRKTYHLFGHTHGKLPNTAYSCDVGVDSWNYTPVTMAQIKDRLNKEFDGK